MGAKRKKKIDVHISPAAPQPISAAPDFAHFIAENDYGRYCVPQAYADREVPQLLADGKIYEPETLKLLRGMVGDGDIISGGAFIGDFFPALSGALAPGALYHTFEPSPVTHAAARHTITLNGLDNVVLHQVAVSNEPGTLPLLTARREGGPELAAAAKIVPGETGNHVVNVEVTTLDDLIPANRKISVLHLDIEGYELQALMGAKRIIAEHKPIIVLEAAKRSMQRVYKRALRNHFPDLRYHITDVIERNAIYVPYPGRFDGPNCNVAIDK